MAEQKEKIAQVFESYPGVEHVFVTKDGSIFLPSNERDAKNHASTLDGKVDRVNRPQPETESVVEDDPTTDNSESGQDDPSGDQTEPTEEKEEAPAKSAAKTSAKPTAKK